MQPNQLGPASDTEADQMLARWADEHADALFRFALSKVLDQHAIGQADEFGTVQLLGAGGWDNFLGTGTPIGTVSDPIGPTERLATITIASVPEPTSLLLGALTAGINDSR